MKIEVDPDAVELGEPAFCEAPKGFDAIDVSATLGEGLLLVDAHVLVIADIDQAIVSGPAIGADNALGIDPPSNDGSQGVLGAIRHDFRINFSLPLKDAEDGLLEGSPASQPGQGASANPAGTKVAFIDFHHSVQFPALMHSLQGDQQPEPLVEAVDRLAVEPQKCRSLRGCKVQTKALHHFFDSIFA